MALPWQDISTLKDSDWDGMVLLYQPFSRHGINGYDYRMDSASHLKDNWEDVCKVGQWLPIPTPEAKTVEVLMENSSANEKQPAKETEKMALPWQDISTLEDYEGDGDIQVYAPVYGGECYPTKDAAQQASKKLKFTHWFPITPPKTTTVEVPVEPERVSVQEFAKDPACKWVNTSDGCPIKGWYQIQKEGEAVMGLPFKLWDIAKKDHPIYATDPTAWLAGVAEQQGNK